jgi:hypothetical protein
VAVHEPQIGPPPGQQDPQHELPVSARGEGAFGVSGGSELSALAEVGDWASGPLGDPREWPQSLRTAVGICLSSRFPILLWWGPELVMIYNDAYRPMLGQKHPRALGTPGREVWGEIWDVIGPMLEQVMTGGGATWSVDQLLVLERNGYPEECYFTYSYSPITAESGGVGGVFCAVTETTERVLGERRLATLAEMAALAGARDRAQVVATTAGILRANAADHPFVAVLDAPPDGDLPTLGDLVEKELPGLGARARYLVTDLVRQVSGTGRRLTVPGDDEAVALGIHAWHAYPVAVTAAQAHGRSTAVIVLSESVHRPWDPALEAYAALCATQVAAVLADVEREQHLRRAVESHREIGQAVGILVERHRLTPTVAFERLKRTSQDHNTKLREVALRVIESGADPGQPEA